MDLIEFKRKFEHKKVIEEPNLVSFKPLVSVCVQTYQHANFIKECLNGILMQKTNFEFEILLGEDASTDGTREICIHYAERYPDKIRLFLHHRENNIALEGSPTGRFIFMTNLLTARGEYIALCEGDDYWTDPYKLQKQVDFLENNKECSACFTNALVFHKDGSKEAFKKLDNNKFYNFKEILNGGGGFFPTATLVFRNRNLELPDFFVKAKSGDRALALLLALKGAFYYFNDRTAVYRRHEGGIFSRVSSNKKERLKIDLNNLNLLNDFNKYSKFKYDEIIESKLSQLSLRILMKYSYLMPISENDNLIIKLKFYDRTRLIFFKIKNLWKIFFLPVILHL